MSGTDEATTPGEEAADRIEQALDRIAVLAARVHPASGNAADGTEGIEAMLAPRLDAVIARLRQALGN